jgi:RES domain-containing protein
MTAVREANQVGTLQPTTLVAYEAELARVFDTTDESALEEQGMDAAVLAASSWRDEMTANGESRTQTFARSLLAKGFSALLVRSFARGASPRDLNMVLWQWGAAPPARLTVIDDEGRLVF